VLCFRCGNYKEVVDVGPIWKVRCKDCTLGQTKESKSLAEAAARRHMLMKRHTVLIWDLRGKIEDTLQIFQPATNTQLSLSDIPPF
jgi:hypothetical protein